MNADRTSNYLFAGTLLVCLSLLAFEIFCARLLSIVVGPYAVLFVLALAMLGMSAATSMMSLFDWPPRAAPVGRALFWLCVIQGASYLLALFQITATNGSSNAVLSRAIDAGGLDALVETSQDTLVASIGMAGFILSIPYFIFGVFIAVLFRSSAARLYAKLYFFDLAGAASGCVLCIVVLEFYGYPGMFVVAPVAAFAAAAAFGMFGGTRGMLLIPAVGAAATIGVAMNASLLAYFEPAPELSRLSRDYDKSYQVVQEWWGWNSHSRVARLSLTPNDQGSTRDIYAQADGTGWANVPYKSLDEADSVFQAALTTALAPRKVLVMFAGVGYDMHYIDHLCRRQCEITGVEINGLMVDHAFAQDRRLAEFFARPNIELVVAEARAYLESDDDRYDAILLAWSGAGYSYYLGTAGMLSQYLYTKEALESLLDHLAPGGTLIISDGSKARLLRILRRVFEERGQPFTTDSFIVAKDRAAPTFIATSPQLDVFDKNRLIVKPDGFTAEEVEEVRSAALRSGQRLVAAPDGVNPDYHIYHDLVKSPNVEAVVDGLVETRGIELSVITDDRPFPFNMTPRSYYLFVDSPGSDEELSPPWIIAKALLEFFVLLAIVALVLLITPLLLTQGPKRSWRNLEHLLYFGSVGAGFMLIEVGLVQKLGLLMGNPAYAIAVVLAIIILATGIGAYWSNKLFSANWLGFRTTSLAVVLYALGLIIFLDPLIRYLLPEPVIVKAVAVAAMLFPLGFLMGQLFPQGLVKAEAEDVHLVPWAWALNGAASTIAVGVGFFMSQPLGFNAVIVAGIVCYALILVLPSYGRAGYAASG